MPAKKTRKSKEDADQKEINIFESGLVPTQELLTEDQKAMLLQKLNISMKQLPRMKSSDAVAKVLGGKRGDVVRVMRKSPVAGEYQYFRVIV